MLDLTLNWAATEVFQNSICCISPLKWYLSAASLA